MADTQANALQGKRVVVTRAAQQSETLVSALLEKGAAPVLLPLVAFAPPDDLAPLDQAIRHLKENDWLFLTSQNALRALQERASWLQIPFVEAVAGVRIAVVGPATAEAVKNAGLRVSYTATKHQGVSLARELAAELKGKRVLLPRSDRANRELVEELNRIGARVTEVVAYKTVRPEGGETSGYQAVFREGVDAVLFFSPSAVHHLRELMGPAGFRKLCSESAFAAIGPVTAAALREAGVDRVILARDTTVAAALEALEKCFANYEQTGVKRG